MAMKLEELEAHLDALEMKYRRTPDDSDGVLLSFTVNNYVNPGGEKSVRMAIALEQEGRFLKVFAPMAYKVPEGPRRESVLVVLLHICWKTKMLQFEYDVNDGEVRAIVEWPIEDGTVTQRQLYRSIHGLCAILDKYHAVIQRAIDTGVVDFPADPDSARLRTMAELLELLGDADPAALRAAVEAMKAGSGSAGGPTEL